MNTLNASDLLGAWAESATSKSLGEPEAATWTLDVSSAGALAVQREALVRDAAAFTIAATRLSAFVDAWEPGKVATAKSLEAFTPEDKLRDALNASATSAHAKDLFDPLREAKVEFDAFITRVRELTSAWARVETSVAGTPIAQTLVRHSGDVDTVWTHTATVEQIGLHRENVRIALARRAMLMRFVVAICTGAAKIVIRLATPGTQLLVLPAVWQFVQDVVKQLRELKDSERLSQ